MLFTVAGLVTLLVMMLIAISVKHSQRCTDKILPVVEALRLSA